MALIRAVHPFHISLLSIGDDCHWSFAEQLYPKNIPCLWRDGSIRATPLVLQLLSLCRTGGLLLTGPGHLSGAIEAVTRD